MQPEWLTKKTAGRYADVSPRTIHTWIAELGLRHSKIRGTVLIKKAWLDEFLESHEEASKLDQIVDEVMRD